MLNLLTTPKEFRDKVEKLVTQNNVTYLEAVCHCCHVMGIEIDTAAKLLDKPTKEIIKEEAEKLHLLRK